jgi:hypothetical protein
VGSSSKQDPQWDPDGLEVTDQRIARKPKDGNRNSGGRPEARSSPSGPAKAECWNSARPATARAHLNK